jgi:hypothetical protein
MFDATGLSGIRPPARAAHLSALRLGLLAGSSLVAPVLAAGPAQARLCECEADGLMVRALPSGRNSLWPAEGDGLAGYLAEAGDHTRHAMDDTVRAALRFAAPPA